MALAPLDPELVDRLHLVSAKWVLPLVLVLREGERRYTDIEAALPGISPRALTDKLRLLGEHYLVDQVQRRDRVRSKHYRLTPAGAALADAADALASWAAGSKGP